MSRKVRRDFSLIRTCLVAPLDFKDTSKMTEEEKKEFSKKRLLEMKMKNEVLLQRHIEVEEDRIAAEGNSSIISKAKKTKLPKTSSREWDRGKTGNWMEYCSTNKYCRSGTYDRKDNEDSWSGYRTKKTAYETARSHSSPKRKIHYRSVDSYRKRHHYSDEKDRKDLSISSRNKYDSKDNLSQDKYRKTLKLWHSSEVAEEETKLQHSQTSKSYSKFDRYKDRSSESSEDDNVTHQVKQMKPEEFQKKNDKERNESREEGEIITDEENIDNEVND